MCCGSALLCWLWFGVLWLLRVVVVVVVAVRFASAAWRVVGSISARRLLAFIVARGCCDGVVLLYVCVVAAAAARVADALRLLMCPWSRWRVSVDVARERCCLLRVVVGSGCYCALRVVVVVLSCPRC